MKLEAAPTCPVCARTGQFVIREAVDHLLGVSGTWAYRRCDHCASLWLDPCPATEDIPSLYPEHYYTHTDEDPLACPASSRWGRVRWSCKLGAVAQRYRYPELRSSAPSRFGFDLGRWLSPFPGVAGKVGFLPRFLEARAAGRLLDVGAANGGFLRLMKRLGWTVSGIELDRKAAALAQAHGLDVQIVPIEDVVLPAAAYDAITLSHVIEHLKSPPQVIARLAQSLRPGGVLVSISPNPTGWNARQFGGHWRGLEPPRHLVLPSAAGYDRMLAPLGFRSQIWTTLRWFYPSYLQSRGLQTLADAYGYRGRLGPKLVAWLVRLLSSFKHDLGEEVVCVAVKQACAAPAPVPRDAAHLSPAG